MDEARHAGQHHDACGTSAARQKHYLFALLLLGYIFLHSGVTGACPATTDLIMQVGWVRMKLAHGIKKEKNNTNISTRAETISKNHVSMNVLVRAPAHKKSRGGPYRVRVPWASLPTSWAGPGPSEIFGKFGGPRRDEA